MPATVSVSTIAERTLRRLNVAVVPLDDRPTMTEMVPVATIATMALVELGVIASDETPLASDQALALDKVASVHAGLDAQALVWWDATAVPRAFVEEYTKLAAAQMASSFGKAADPSLVALLEGRVRRGAMGIASHDIAVEGVMAVHTELVGKGIARWTSGDIPEMAAPAYEMLAAYNLAPKFPPAEQKPADVVQAMRTLFTITALPTSGERVVAEYF
jgi:hypothetical protein